VAIYLYPQFSLRTTPDGQGPLSFTNPIIEDDTDGKTGGNLGVLLRSFFWLIKINQKKFLISY
jgi:hypothetical protein